MPPFTDATEVVLPVACSYDLEVNAASYLSALEQGEVPLEFLFSGSVFYSGANGLLQTARISWEREAEYRLPVSVWRKAMDRHFPQARPGCVWSDPAFDRLRAYKAEHGLRTLGGGGRAAVGGGVGVGAEAQADVVRRIADAVLYEGYMLWPYRKSALKNQQRFTFGGVYPPAWDDRSSMQAQVLLEGGEDVRIDVRVRFLQVVRRQVLRRGAPGELPRRSRS